MELSTRRTYLSDNVVGGGKNRYGLHWPDNQTDEKKGYDPLEWHLPGILAVLHPLEADAQFAPDDEDLQRREQFTDVFDARCQPCVEDASIVVRIEERLVEGGYKPQNRTRQSADEGSVDERRVERHQLLLYAFGEVRGYLARSALDPAVDFVASLLRRLGQEGRLLVYLLPTRMAIVMLPCFLLHFSPAVLVDPIPPVLEHSGTGGVCYHLADHRADEEVALRALYRVRHRATFGDNGLEAPSTLQRLEQE